MKVICKPTAEKTMNFYITINGKNLEFLFEEGMTWEEFVNSKYNENNDFHIMVSIKYQSGLSILLNDSSVLPIDKIKENASYTAIFTGNSGGGIGFIIAGAATLTVTMASASKFESFTSNAFDINFLLTSCFSNKSSLLFYPKIKKPPKKGGSLSDEDSIS